MIKTTSLSVHYGQQAALQSISIHIQPGEIYCLLGANGAGKTTLINTLLGFVKPSQGEAFIGPYQVTQQAMLAKRLIAYIPEQVNLYPTLTGVENLAYFAKLATGESLAQSELLGLLSKSGLQHEACSRPVGTYSKGMRQKVGIAIALAKKAKALLLDEPTSGLDPSAAKEFSDLLTEASQSGVAVLTTTHDLFHAKQTGNRIGIMRQGQLIEECVSSSITYESLQTLYLEQMRVSA